MVDIPSVAIDDLAGGGNLGCGDGPPKKRHQVSLLYLVVDPAVVLGGGDRRGADTNVKRRGSLAQLVTKHVACRVASFDKHP